MTDHSAKDDTENGVPIWRVVDSDEADVFAGKVICLSKHCAVELIRNCAERQHIMHMRPTAA